MKLSDAMQEVTDRMLLAYWTPTTWDINNGFCEEWAEDVAKLAGVGEPTWMEHLDEELLHCALLVDGVWYDAECHEGVKDWRDLPICRNKGKTRAQVLAERKLA